MCGLNDQKQRIRARRGLLLNATLLVFGGALAGCGPEPGETARGELAAAAMSEVLGGDDRGDARLNLMQSRDWNIPKGIEPWHDGYPSWLAAWLVRRAADGTLFVRHNDAISLWMPEFGGDDVFWCIGRATRVSEDGKGGETSGPWVFWRYYGTLVTPDPDDPPGSFSQEYFALSNVSWGDLVELDVFRVSMTELRSIDIDGADLSGLIKDGSARLILRLRVPVVTKP